MAVESGARASKTLSGDLNGRPLAVLLAGAGERGTSGTFVFRHAAREDSLTLRAGKVAVVRTSEPVAYLGGILYELGFIDMAMLNSTLLEVARAKRLHGEVLMTRGAVSRPQLDEALAEQTFRKVHHLFSLPGEATWAFREDVDELTGARDEDRPPIPTWQAIWRGLREHPQAQAPHVRRTLAKVEGVIQLKDLAFVECFGLADAELALCRRLHAQPATLANVITASPLVHQRTELLLYLLTLARCVVRVDARPVGPIELGVNGVRDRAIRIETEDPYTVLGLRPDASREAARAAYFRLARLWHPDKIPNDLHQVRSECEQVFFHLGEAHRILTDVSARQRAEELVGSALVPANDSVAPPASRATMRDVDSALARNDLATAAKLAQSLTSAGADGPAARATIAWCEIGATTAAEPQALESALATIDKVLTGDPDCVRALFYRGQILKSLGRSDPATRDFRRIVRLDPGHVEAQREVRISDMRRRTGSSEMQQSPPVPQPASAPATPEPLPTSPEESSVRSGLRRLIARVARR
jgi:tetratricopeptide (TPR) repeat protein